MFDLTTLDESKLNEALRNAETKLPETNQDPILQYKAGMGHFGEWIVGQEATEVTGQKALFLAGSVMRGYSAFEHREDGDKRPPKFLGEVMAPLFSNQAADSAELTRLPNADVSKKTTVKVYLPETKLQALFRSSTRGSEDGVSAVINQIVARLRGGERTYVHPLVELGRTSYDHPTYKSTNKPVFKIVAWCDVAGNEQPQPQTLESRV